MTWWRHGEPRHRRLVASSSSLQCSLQLLGRWMAPRVGGPAMADDAEDLHELWKQGLVPLVQRLSFRRPVRLEDSGSGTADAKIVSSAVGLAAAFLDRLPADARSTVFAAAGQDRSFATICSGTDAPALCITGMARAMRERWSHAVRPARQEYACERSPEKRAFLSTMCGGSCGRLFGEVSELLAPEARDHLQDARGDQATAGGRALVPQPQGIIAGFPCQDASRLNSHYRQGGRSNRECVAQGSKRTGGVFQSILQVLEQHNISWCILENVRTLASPPMKAAQDGRRVATGPSNLDTCVYRLRERGFWVCVFDLDALHFGQLHSRARLYMLCVRQSILLAGGLAADAATAVAEQTMSSLVGREPLLKASLDDMLLADDHPCILQRYRAAAVRQAAVAEPCQVTSLGGRPKRARGSSDGKGVATASSTSSAAESQALLSSEADLTLLYPGLLELSERQAGVLRHHFRGLPSSTPMALDLNMSQGWCRPARGRLGCITTGSSWFFTHRCRFLVPLEAFRLMGIHFEEHEAMLQGFCDRLLWDLAGNAFDGASFTAVWVTLLRILGTLR